MKTVVPLFAALIVLAADGASQTPKRQSTREQAVEKELKRLSAYEVDLVLRSDIVAMERFYPDDMIVTNPFNQVIDKQKVLERVRANIISYTSMTKEIEHLRLIGDMAIIMGLETAKVSSNADRADANKMTYRRFTEVWMLRGAAWKKVARHANHFEPDK